MAVPTTYASFLVRLWQEELPGSPETGAFWQGELEHIQTGQHWDFHTLSELFDLLRHQAEKQRMRALSEG